MELNNWDVLKSILSWVIYPATVLLGFFFKKQASDMTAMKEEIIKLKLNQAVIETQTKDIREDIRDLMVFIREHEKEISNDIKSLRQDILSVSKGC